MFLTHGEDGLGTALRDQLAALLGLQSTMPTYGNAAEM
jgi:hypothetical protein